MMSRIWQLAILTFKEGVRDRAIYGVMIIAIMMLTATIGIVSLFGHELGKVAIDLSLSTVAFSGLILTFFVNINLIGKDIDKHTIHCVLSKPISRKEYILGKYAGLFSLVAVSISFLALSGAAITALIKASHPAIYFADFSWKSYFQAFYYELAMFLILNAVIVFFSTITTSSFLTFLYSVSVYVAGQSIEEVVQFLRSGSAGNLAVSAANRWLIEVIQYIFPNFSAFDIKVMASHGMLMPGVHTIVLLGYSIIYTAMLLFFAILIFERRELQ